MSEKRPMTRAEMRRRRRKKALMIKMIILIILAVVLVIAILALTGKLKMKSKSDTDSQTQTETVTPEASDDTSADGTADATDTEEADASATVTPASTETTGDPKTDGMNQAAAQATQYDYDGAIATLQAIPGADTDADIIAQIADYETIKSTLVAWEPYDVTHVFYHSLVVDPSRGFSLSDTDEAWNNATIGFCEWMTTVDEFNAITQQMYDRGYVMVSLYDLVDITEGEDGVRHVTAKNIYLPEGKTPFVLSLDDLSYYHSYDGRGCATRMIVGDDGTPTCEYVDADGNTLVGSYDCVPLMDDFLETHPDFSYKGAKGTIALTGYDGILGYRTDYCYRDRVDLTSDQEAWLAVHPEYNWDNECAQAKAVADAIKADGWTFASHTWGHIRIGTADLTWIQEDTQKWLDYVEPLIGETNIIIFAHGEDLCNWNEEYSESEKFQYLKSQGFDIFCNVDSSQYFVQIGDQYLRMGRRNLDGYRLWEAVYDDNDQVSDLFDAASVFDPQRPTDASLYDL